MKIQLLGKRCFSDTLKTTVSQTEVVEQDPYAFYKKVGCPKYFVAPMVD